MCCILPTNCPRGSSSSWLSLQETSRQNCWHTCTWTWVWGKDFDSSDSIASKPMSFSDLVNPSLNLSLCPPYSILSPLIPPLQHTYQGHGIYLKCHCTWVHFSHNASIMQFYMLPKRFLRLLIVSPADKPKGIGMLGFEPLLTRTSESQEESARMKDEVI